MNINWITPSMCYIIAFIGTLLTAFSQILLKLQAKKNTNKNFVLKFLNVRVILSYGLLFMTLVLNQIALIHVPVSVLPCITALSFVWIFLLSHFFLKESASKTKIVGVIIILIGVLIARI